MKLNWSKEGESVGAMGYGLDTTSAEKDLLKLTNELEDILRQYI